ncbi:MAG: hypothetical protein ACERKZ_01835 [Lachnotalea sp.]
MERNLLPATIATDWSGISAIKEANKIVIFLVPIVMIITTVFAKALISNFLYRNMPQFLIFVDYIVGYFCICIAIIIFTYQMNIILFTGGVIVDFYKAVCIEIVMSLAYVLIVYLQNKKSIC